MSRSAGIYVTDVRRRRLSAAVLAAVAALLCIALSMPPVRGGVSRLPLTRERNVRLPGRPTRFDYQSIDGSGRRLYIAHLGDSAVDVVDLDSFTVIAHVPGLPDVHGVLAVPEIGRVFASATGADELVTLDAPTNQVITRTPTGRFPDGIAYDRRDDLVLVSNKNDGSETVLEGRSGRVVRTVRLGREVGNVAYDAVGGLAYVAARPPDELVGLDPTTGSRTRRIRLENCRGAHGVYVQAETQLAFVACEGNASVVTVDLAEQHQLATDSVGANPDVLAYDPIGDRLYVATESGVVTVFSTSSKRLRKLGQGRLAATAHSVAVDPTTQLVYFPLERDPKKPRIRVMRPIDTQR